MCRSTFTIVCRSTFIHSQLTVVADGLGKNGYEQKLRGPRNHVSENVWKVNSPSFRLLIWLGVLQVAHKYYGALNISSNRTAILFIHWRPDNNVMSS